MRVVAAAVGRLKAGAERELFDRYRIRFNAIGRQTGLGPLTEFELPESPRRSPEERCADEAGALLGKIPDGAILVALDEAGKSLTSAAFAETLARYRDNGAGEIAFAIGGSDGHGAALRDHAALRLSLGPMTLPHGLARVLLAEQLYRAAAILAGHPYHRA